MNEERKFLYFCNNILSTVISLLHIRSRVSAAKGEICTLDGRLADASAKGIVVNDGKSNRTKTNRDMKKIVALLTMMMGTLAVYAADYAYLSFETTDGAKASVSVDNLTLTISGTTLTAGSQSFTLSNLSKMYFSTTDETKSSIAEIASVALDEATDIYDLQGYKVTKEQMREGVYIVKTKNGTYKMVVR